MKSLNFSTLSLMRNLINAQKELIETCLEQFMICENEQNASFNCALDGVKNISNVLKNLGDEHE